jgi:hypothetical protein
MGLDTKTYWLTDRQLQCDFDFNNELFVRQSPAGKNVSTEAEDTVEIRYQATTGEDIANWEDFTCAVVTVIFGVCNSVRLSQLFVVTDLQVVSKSKSRLYSLIGVTI